MSEAMRRSRAHRSRCWIATSRASSARHWLAAPEPDHFLLIDPDAEVRQILLAEVAALTHLPVREIAPHDAGLREALPGAVPLCRPSKTKMVRAALPPGIELITLPIRSANRWLGAQMPPQDGLLVGIVSHWPEFVAIAQAMLIAAGIENEALVCRDARKPNWQRGLERVSGILCDVYTAKSGKLPKNVKAVVFPLLAEGAGEELRRFSPESSGITVTAS
jgi:GntR family transcriptional regulator